MEVHTHSIYAAVAIFYCYLRYIFRPSSLLYITITLHQLNQTTPKTIFYSNAWLCKTFSWTTITSLYLEELHYNFLGLYSSIHHNNQVRRIEKNTYDLRYAGHAAPR